MARLQLPRLERVFSRTAGFGGLGARLRLLGCDTPAFGNQAGVAAAGAVVAAASATAAAKPFPLRPGIQFAGNESQSGASSDRSSRAWQTPAASRSEDRRSRYWSLPLGAFASMASAATLCEEPGNITARPELREDIPPEVALERSTVRLYQFESCPFCRKVRGCLDYKRIPYEIVEVHPLSKAETKDIAPDYKKVPVLEVDSPAGKHIQIRDSKTIVRALLGSNRPGVNPGVLPPKATASTSKMWGETDNEGTVEEQWIRWTDKVLVQCIVLNVYRTMSESAETFQYLLTHPEWPWYAQRSAQISGTVVMWGVCKMRKRKYEVTDERNALYEALGAFSEEVKRGGGRFLSGAKPGAVDFNVYGILRSTESCQTERDMMEHCPAIGPWFAAMNEVVGQSCAANSDSIKRGS